MDLTYWYLLPIGILVAGVANGAGIGGATFFSPLFILALRLEPTIAIGAALATEVFGFASGVTAHARAKTVDWSLARSLSLLAVPGAIIGSVLAGVVSPVFLKLLLGMGLLLIAVAFIRHRGHKAADAAIARGEGIVQPAEPRQIITRDGETINYQLCRKREGRWFAGVGGISVGMISTGLGELNAYALVKRCRIPTRVTVATSVVVVAVTALAASAVHFIGFFNDPDVDLSRVFSIVAFTIPGVLIGGQLGPLLTRRVKDGTLIRSLGWLFLAVAAITLIEAGVGA